MNGNTLKNTFSGIVGVLMFIMLVLTGLLAFGKLNIEAYKEVLGILGIPTLIGMIVQSFIHSDRDHNGIPDVKEDLKKEGTKIE